MSQVRPAFSQKKAVSLCLGHQDSKDEDHNNTEARHTDAQTVTLLCKPPGPFSCLFAGEWFCPGERLSPGDCPSIVVLFDRAFAFHSISLLAQGSRQPRLTS